MVSFIIHQRSRKSPLLQPFFSHPYRKNRSYRLATHPKAEEAPPCGGDHTFPPLGQDAETIRSAKTPPVAEVILSHPFGGTIVNRMEGKGGIHKGKETVRCPALMPPSRGATRYSLLGSKSFLAEMKIGRTFQTHRSLCEHRFHPPSLARHVSLLLGSKPFSRNENPIDFL